METKVDILNELRLLSPLLSGMEKINVFTVPDGYFEYLSADILATLNEDNNFLNTLPVNTPGDVPAGYFDSLADTILNRIKAQQNITASDELRDLSPMLYSIQNENVFEVPHRYFEELAENIMERVKPQPAKLVSMPKRSISFMKYAVAAAFTGVMALGIFKFTETKSPVNEVPVYVAEGLKHHNVDEELSAIPADDIIKYLQANEESLDAQTMANKMLDENGLPSQADYLFDEKTLDKYLDNAEGNKLIN